MKCRGNSAVDGRPFDMRGPRVGQSICAGDVATINVVEIAPFLGEHLDGAIVQQLFGFLIIR